MTKYILFPIGILFLFLASCNKGCDFPDDENTGEIIPDAIVYGGNTGGVAAVHHGPSGQYDLKVSFDNGYTYVPIDWTKYSVLNFPVTAGCNTHFERDVTVNNSSSNVRYKITVESCPDCESEYRTDNWVLVNKFPASYIVDREKKVK